MKILFGGLCILFLSLAGTMVVGGIAVVWAFIIIAFLPQEAATMVTFLSWGIPLIFCFFFLLNCLVPFLRKEA